MKSCLVLLVATFLTLGVSGQPIHRLLLFANDSNAAELKTQLEWLRADSAEVVAHQIWIAVFASPKKMRRMYEHYNVGSSPFTVVLVGPGGVEYLRSEKPMEPRHIFSAIEKQAQVTPNGNDPPKGNCP